MPNKVFVNFDLSLSLFACMVCDFLAAASGMLSLFMVISQGLNWEDLARPLFEVSAIAGVLLIFYVT